MSLSDYKSPHGKAKAMVSRDVETWLQVETPDGDYRYFYSKNWTYFQKDLALEITEDEYTRPRCRKFVGILRTESPS